MMIGSLIYAMIDRWPSQPVWPSSEMLVVPLIKFGVSLGLAVAAALLLAKYLPQTALYQRLVLAETVPAVDPHVVPERRVFEGMTGLAHTTLRPSGKATFGGQLVDVVSQGEFIESGAPVRVVSIEGARVVVETV
jgi:membrane-bound serine protease (ClpP class)